MEALPREVKCVCPDENEVHLPDCKWEEARENYEEVEGDEFCGYAKQAIGERVL